MLQRVVGPSVLVIALVVGVWYLLQGRDETRDVRSLLDDLSASVNSSTTDGRGPEARAAQLGAFFTEDVEIDLGRGAAPIRGRAMVISMAERLQPRTAAFRLKFEDVAVALDPGGASAAVHLTAEFIRRDLLSGSESLDAREFTLGMQRVADGWLIRRVTGVDTLK
jgi:SnoaL-like protein